MNANYKSITLAISLFFALSTSISAAPGDLDPTFGNGGIVITGGSWISHLDTALAMAIQSDGKIVVVGDGATSQTPGVTWDFAVVRNNTDGSIDSSFGGGIVITPVGNSHDAATSVAIQADGKIVVVGVICNGVGDCSGAGTSFAVVRYNPNGSLDTSFNGTGIVITSVGSSGGANSVAIQADGKIVVAGGSWGNVGSNTDFAIVRYNTDGSLDTTFNGTGKVITPVSGNADSANSVVIQSDGKIVAAGEGQNSFAVARYNTDGLLDTSFNGTGIVITPVGNSSRASDLAIQSNGKIVVVGGSPPCLNNNFTLVRYNADGSLDTSLNGTGIVVTPVGSFCSRANSVAIQADGKIVASGNSSSEIGTFGDFTVVRYSGNGSLDTTFGGTGIVITPITNRDSDAASVAIQADGKIVAAGWGGYDWYDFAVVRYQGEPPAACPNPIDCADFFIRQQYRDFLGREPEPEGLQFYLDILNGCQPTDIECIMYTRGALSANFFRSPEFQRKGSFVMYLYMVSIGQRPVTPAELLIKNDPLLNDRPHYAEFMADLQSISTPNDDPALTETKKAALADAWMQRAEIQALYPAAPTMTNAQFVQRLLDTAGVTISNQSQLVTDLNNQTKTRAQVLRIIAESPEVNAKFYKQAFVTMEYFGYLRRDPEDCHNSANWTGNDPNQCGFIFHNNRFNLGFDPAEVENVIVRGFIESPEYRHRFGP